MSVFENAEFDAHESVHEFYDDVAGLKAIIAIHSTALGPAAGGCRFWQYPHEAAAMTDALRLSRGMTYKNALAGLPFGGGKAVILAQPTQQKSARLFNAFGRCVNSLHGNYVTAEDVGVTPDDMRHVQSSTRYVAGLPSSSNTVGGDPSPWTAYGVFLSIKKSVQLVFGARSLKGLRVAVQGVGSVGYQLCRRLHAEGVELTIADVNPRTVERLQKEFQFSAVDSTEILSQDVDLLAPCALGGILNFDTIPKIKARIIAGAANNQLATDQDGCRLIEHDILYAPDYVINAGGIISVAREYVGGSSVEQLSAEIRRIPQRLAEIISVAASSSRSTHAVANEIARSIVATARTQGRCLPSFT